MSRVLKDQSESELELDEDFDFFFFLSLLFCDNPPLARSEKAQAARERAEDRERRRKAGGGTEK